MTSGGDEVFPRGLAVGTIASVEPDRDHQPYTILTLRPAANLFELDEVLVITGLGAALPADVQEQLTEDQALHAADVSAERLPGLHDGADAKTGDAANPDASADDGTPPPENSTSLVPKPKPALHPDRYSPGETPPASALMPGAGRPTALTETPEPAPEKSEAGTRAATPKPAPKAAAPRTDSLDAPKTAAPTPATPKPAAPRAAVLKPVTPKTAAPTAPPAPGAQPPGLQ